jgi:poly [ADP-ribose] polymerase
MEYSSNFYTQIPHDFGFQKMSNFIIDTIEKVKEKIDMISALSDMKITLKILENVESEKDEEYENQEEKQLHDYYKQLNCDIRCISINEPIYSILEKYLTAKICREDYNNFGYCYGHRNKLALIKAYELNRHGERKKFKDFGNKKLLWHGSRMTNFVGILSQGLRIAPPEAPSSGYLYGKGVYFADMSQKSSCYCYPVNGQALILLGEVSLGEEDKRTSIDFNLPSTMDKNANSVHALGRLEPSGGENIDGDVFVPYGEAKVNEKNSLCNDHAEYIVYNVDQIKLRYLLKIKCT